MAGRTVYRPIMSIALLLTVLLSWSVPFSGGSIRIAAASANLSPSAAVIIDNGLPDGRMGMGARIEAGALQELEPADDFILTASNQLTSATFFGLLPSGAPVSTIQDVVVEIYRVFPKDSANPPSGR